MNKHAFVRWALPCAFAAVPVWAQAQNEQPQAIGNMVVFGELTPYFENSTSTAMKGETDDMLVPYTTNVINSQVLEDLKATRLQDALVYLPGFSRSGSSANSFTIRGMSADLQNIQVDGLPGLVSRFGSPPSANIDSVEVLKGPASILYGLMEPGGMVNIITKKPQAETLREINLTAEHYTGQGESGIRGNIDLTGALDQDAQWLYRLVAGNEQLDSFRDNVDSDSLYIYPSLSWVPNSDTRLNMQLEYVKDDRAADNGLFVLDEDIHQIAEIETRYQEVGDFDNDEGTALSLDFQHQINRTLKAQAKWRSVWHEDERDLYENNSVQSNDTLRRRNRHQYNKREYHFVDANLNWQLAGAVQHNLTAGVNSGYEYRQYDRLAFDTRGANVSLHNPQLTGQVLEDDPGNFRRWNIYNYGLYLNDQITLNDQWTLVAGARYDYQQGDYELRYRDRDTRADAESNSDSTLFNGGLVYSLSDQVSLYASYAQSFNPQTIATYDINGDQLAAEEGDQKEIGVKLSLLDEALNINLALFDIEKSNIAEENSETGFDELVGNITSRGTELLVQYQPVENWQLQAGYAYTDAQVSNTFNADTLGSVPAFAPEHAATLWARYNHPQRVLDGLVGAGFGWRYESERFTSSERSRRVRLPSYSVVDLSAYYEINDVKLALNIDNLFDTLHYVGGRRDTSIYAGEPRKVSLSATMKF